MSDGKNPGELPYLTEAQEDYLRDREESKRYCNPFKSYLPQIEKYWADLEQPEASWDIRDLRASGKQFPYPFPVQGEDYRWRMETRYKVLDNTLLVGHQVFSHLISAYDFCGAYTFAKWRDAPKCKEYFYLAAYCQEKLCHWPIEDPYQVTMNFVSSHQIKQFMMAVIADGEEDFVRKLGEMLMLPEHNIGKSAARKQADTVGKTTIYLAYGEDKKARRAAEQLLAYEEKRRALKSQKNRPLTWTCYAQGALAVLDGDEEGLDTALRGYIKALRGDGKPVKDLAPYLMAHYAVFLGKMAVRRGMNVTVDTLDCPKELMATVPTDYSYLDLPKPKDGFPWERKRYDGI